MLLQARAKEPEWYVVHKKSEAGALTHVFYMTPEMRRQAADLFQVLIHDNTYKSNRFGLLMGVFSTVNRYASYPQQWCLCMDVQRILRPCLCVQTWANCNVGSGTCKQGVHSGLRMAVQ